MQGLRQLLNRSPLIARVAPFIAFLVFTTLQGHFGPLSNFYLYAAKTFFGALMTWAMWPLVTEMRWAFSWEAFVAGVGVFALWVGLDPYYPKLGSTESHWNAAAQFGQNSPLAWTFILIRILGSGLVVPPLEEVFYRSFVYRYIIKPNFLEIPLNHFDPRAFVITVLVFAAAHPAQWLAAILCGVIYQGLVLRKNRLGDGMTAHAITNILLGSYVAWKGQWQFW
jgi:CAAX prenyl protease-like protein